MIEIRLEASDPATLEPLLATGVAGEIRGVKGPVLRRTAELVDTSDWALARARLSLELRGRPPRRELSVAWDESGRRGIVRREVLQPLPALPRGAIATLSGPVGDRVRAVVAGRALQPVLSLSLVRRRVDFPFRPRGPGARTRTIRVLVDTLLAGPPGGVAASRVDQVVVRSSLADAARAESLAARLSATFGLRPAPMAGSLRGLMLVHGDAPFLDRSGAAVASDPLGVAARKVLALHLRRVQQHDPGTRSGVDAEELHDMRVGSRRLRAALRVFAPAIAPTTLGRFVVGLRRLGRQLGAVRDLDVLLSRLPEGHPAFLRYLELERAAARVRLHRALNRRPYLDLVLALDRFVGGAAAGETPAATLEPAGPHAAEAIGRAFRGLRRAGRLARTRATARSLHDVRIRAKRLRYALEFFAAAAGPEAATLIERLTELQDLLGAHQDAVIGARLVRKWGRAGGSASKVAARVAEERSEALACRERFGRAWDRFEGKESRRPLERVLRRLDPDRRDKKKGDAASGVP